MTEPRHEGKAYSLTGSLVTTARGQVETLAKVLGKALQFVEVPEAGARAGMLGAGIPEVMADAVLEVMRASAGRDGGATTDTVRSVTGNDARTFEDWARDRATLFA